VTLGLVFAPFTWKTAVFVAASRRGVRRMPRATPVIFAKFGGRPSEFETKFLFFALMALGALATWAGSEGVLPAYLIGMALAGCVGRDHALIRKIRAVTIGLLTPFYFIRAGYFVSIPAVLAAPLGVAAFLAVEMATKIVSVYPVARRFGSPHKDAMYTTADGLRPHIQDDFGAFRPVKQYHRRKPIFDARRRDHRDGDRAHDDREQSLFAAPSAAPRRQAPAARWFRGSGEGPSWRDKCDLIPSGRD
jgi:hypothetical protein